MNLESIQLRLWSVFFICLGVSINSSAQQQFESSTPPIEILKLKWEKEVRLPRSFDPSIIPGSSTSLSPTTAVGTPTNAADLTRAATKARNDAAEAETVFPLTPGRLPVVYVYSIKVRNSGTKTIQGIAWDYIFLDASGSKPVGTHQFLTYQKLLPGKVVTLQRAIRSPPAWLIQISQNNARTRFTEKAVIECILYFDGSVWRSPMAREGVCDALKNNRATVAR